MGYDRDCRDDKRGSEEFRAVFVACRRVVNSVDLLEKLESIYNKRSSVDVSDGLTQLGFEPASVPGIIHQIAKCRLESQADSITGEAISTAEVDAEKAVESLKSCIAGMTVVPASFTPEVVAELEVDRYKSRLFCKLERWLVECAAAESADSQKAMLIRLVMGAVAQFKSDVKPEDLRLAIPYSVCQRCKEFGSVVLDRDPESLTKSDISTE